jgi:hypothetical protein
MLSQIVPYAGWNRCLKLERGGAELLLTLDVGPRILRYSKSGGPNLFKEFEPQLGKTQGKEWLAFGGHRLWHAPEAFPRSYSPDFEPVALELDGESARLTQLTEPSTGIEKQLEIRMHDDHVVVTHRLTNRGQWPVELSPWALTVMAAGGRALIPQEPFIEHADKLTPARQLVLWHYTRMNDSRFAWGDRLITLREATPLATKQKIGLRNAQGWLGYALGQSLFIKTFQLFPDQMYPDFGCNCELYTEPGFLEVETLGPLTRLEPGQVTSHVEHWQSWQGVDLPEDEGPLLTALAPFLDRLRYPRS